MFVLWFLFLCIVIHVLLMSNTIMKLFLQYYCKKLNINVANRYHTMNLEQAYLHTKQLCESKKLPPDVNVEGVFACNQLDLEEINVYGFDYDYTLACYKSSMGYTLYSLGRDILINKYKYPSAIMNLDYDPKFAIRGLHYDIKKGLLMKLDSFIQISPGSVFHGTTRVPENEVINIYRSRKIPLRYMDPSSDYQKSIGESHATMHELVVKKVDIFLENNPKLREFLERLISARKKLFLITNSPFKFVDIGMSLLVGTDWEKFFDVIIVEARKPKFFTNESRPIRIYDKNTGTNLWDKVNELDRNKIYYQGTIKHLLEMTGWRPSEVLYFGDHPYSDLADVTLEHGWRTGAIISELTHEIDNLNNPEFKRNCNWLQMLLQLIEERQDSNDPNASAILDCWQKECDELREVNKTSFNKQFGSVFRTHHTATFFSRRLFRFADIYSSSVTNLLNYSVKHTFYPRRGVMPHEYTSYFV